ncbi:hypothetical protein [Proteus terrae]|uniref:hypothetical protein n=1 Tax=Proteus terrae TaxID=1574161 RepID=UPI001BAC0853|nr:hypothetical protein [Proteus terrae]QUT03202.1 hypothetical protein KF949_07280 [Proteus terrae subsp. cibarius]
MQPIHKSEELMKSLQERISNEEVSNDFELMQILKEIEKYSNGLEKNHLKALAYSLNNDIDKASHYFELSLQVSNIDYARNYLAVINQRASNIKYMHLLHRFADEYESPTFSYLAYQSCLYIAELSKAEKFMAKVIKLSDEDKRNGYLNEFKNARHALMKYLKLSGLEEKNLMTLANLIIAILDEWNIQIVAINYTNTSAYDEQSNLFMMTAECDDVELLSDMNIELAYRLTEYDEFIGKNFSVFIGGVDDVSKLKERLKWL